MRHEQAAHLAAVGGRAQHQLARDDAVGQDLLVAIDVGQEQVQRLHPLDQPGLDPRPLVAGDDPRQKVGGDDPFGGGFRAIDGEGDALQQEGLLQGPLPLGQLRGGQGRQPTFQCAEVGTHCAIRLEHLVVEAIGAITFGRKRGAGRSNDS